MDREADETMNFDGNCCLNASSSPENWASLPPLFSCFIIEHLHTFPTKWKKTRNKALSGEACELNKKGITYKLLVQLQTKPTLNAFFSLFCIVILVTWSNFAKIILALTVQFENKFDRE